MGNFVKSALGLVLLGQMADISNNKHRCFVIECVHGRKDS